MDLNDAFYFVQVVEKGGFSAAARVLNVPKSKLSRRVKQLEVPWACACCSAHRAS